MNASTISTITSVLGMINPAIGVIGSLIGSFAGKSDVSAKFDKISSQVQDAAGVVTALAPLVQQFADGNDVTPGEVRDALAGMDDRLAEFDRLIKEKSA